ncbi:aldo-keto reductase family 4 member C9-like [Iris pallida]|uniref:Aldo-keto reductase family 4 member C9-like n=1 Tax=Iris pallida TaxID=29817 RepID=A0AAX6FG02_IRIPA|nr:aldo-keto reductase family 4 member C9-like [Iris pallida]
MKKERSEEERCVRGKDQDSQVASFSTLNPMPAAHLLDRGQSSCSQMYSVTSREEKKRQQNRS